MFSDQIWAQEDAISVLLDLC